MEVCRELREAEMKHQKILEWLTPLDFALQQYDCLK